MTSQTTSTKLQIIMYGFKHIGQVTCLLCVPCTRCASVFYVCHVHNAHHACRLCLSPRLHYMYCGSACLCTHVARIVECYTGWFEPYLCQQDVPLLQADAHTCLSFSSLTNTFDRLTINGLNGMQSQLKTTPIPAMARHCGSCSNLGTNHNPANNTRCPLKVTLRTCLSLVTAA